MKSFISLSVLGFLLAILDMQDYVFHLKFVTSLVFLTLNLCQVGQLWLDA